MISSSQIPLPDNTQHSQQTDIHAPGGIRTHDLSKRAAADLRLRPRGHWDRPNREVNVEIIDINTALTAASIVNIWIRQLIVVGVSCTDFCQDCTKQKKNREKISSLLFLNRVIFIYYTLMYQQNCA